jgi:hypothetical protein
VGSFTEAIKNVCLGAILLAVGLFLLALVVVAPSLATIILLAYIASLLERIAKALEEFKNG